MKEETRPLKEIFEEAYKKNGSRSSWKRKPVHEQETGFYRTRKIYCQACKQKFTYRYKWHDKEEKKYKVLTSIDFQKLKEKVKNKNLEWKVDNYLKARKTAKEIGLPLIDLK